MALAAAPRSQAAPTMSTEATEALTERMVRTSQEAKVENSPETHTAPTTRKVNKVVSMAVESDGRISNGETVASPVTIHAKESTHQVEEEPPKASLGDTAATPVTIRAMESNNQVKDAIPKAKKDKEEKKIGKAKPHAVMAAEVPEDQPEQVPIKLLKQEDAPETEGGEETNTSWKSAFFFFASLVLMVSLAGFVAARVYYGKAGGDQLGADKLTLKAHETQSGAAALQQQLNDSSSTSDSGEKIAMLFDRVRKSLEDLGDQAPNDAADVAGAGRGGSQTNTL